MDMTRALRTVTVGALAGVMLMGCAAQDESPAAVIKRGCEEGYESMRDAARVVDLSPTPRDAYMARCLTDSGYYRALEAAEKDN